MPALLTGQEGWLGASFEHEVTPKYGYAVETEYRGAFGAYTRGEFLFTGVLDRQLVTDLHVQAGGRISPSRAGSGHEGRLFVDLYYDLPLGESAFTLEGRLRYQRTRNFSEGLLTRVAVRPRLGLNWAVHDKVALIVEAEARYRFDERNEWVRTRRTAGVIYSLTDRFEVEFFYRRQLDYEPDEPRALTEVFGLYTTYVLPDRRERDWDYRRPFGRRVF